MSRVPILSPNGEKIIRQLIAIPGSWITSAVLADGIGISKRTIMRELPGVEAWMAAVGADFKRSPGKGMILSGDEKQIAYMKELLGDTNETLIIEKDQRVQELFFMLFSSDEPVKQFYLANALGVSERTLSSDLDQLDIWLEKQGLKLQRKSGVGIWMEGEAYLKRRAISQILYYQYPEELLKTMFGDSLMNSDESIKSLLDGSTARQVRSILQDFEEKEDVRFADSGFITLALQTTLLVQDLLRAKKRGEFVENPATKNQYCEVCDLTWKLIERIQDAFAISLSKKQAELLSNYVNAYRGHSLEDGIRGSEMDIRYLGAMLIQYVELELKVNLSRHKDLSDAMYNHLRAMLHRMRNDMYTENPQLELFKTQYGWLWDVIRRACDAAYEIQAYPGLEPISDEEAGFLGMHFGAVLEREDMVMMRIKTVLVCPYGLASSRFLSSQIVKEFPVLHIHGTCSVRELNEEKVRAWGVDLLISTVPLQISFPYVQVNAILQPIDHTILNEAISQCQSRIDLRIKAKKEQAGKPLSMEEHAEAATPSVTEANTAHASIIRYVFNLSGLILDFVDNVKIEERMVLGKRDKLIEASSQLFADSEEVAREIEAEFIRRENLASTYIQPLRTLLLHCKTKHVKGCRFGYVHANPPIYEPGKLIQGAVVMLASEEDSYATEIIRAVSGMLIDQPELIATLKKQKLEEAKAIIEHGMEMYFLYRFSENRRNNK